MKEERLNPTIITAVYSSYRNQRRILNELNRKLSKAKNREEWTSVYLERSATMRAAFEINSETNALINDSIFNQALDYEYAELFFHEDRKVREEEDWDIFFGCKMLERLAEIYREQHDLYRLLPILNSLGQNYISTVKLHVSENYPKALSCYKELLSYRNHYSLIPDISIRKLFFQAYFSLCCILPIIECEHTMPPSQSLDYLLEVLSFYNSDAVQKLDGGSDEIRMSIDMIKENWLWIEYRIEYADHETIQAFIKVAHNVFDENIKKWDNDILKLPVSIVMAYQHALILEGSTSFIDAVNYMIDYYYKKRADYEAHRKSEALNLDEFYFETKLPMALIKWLDKIDILSDMCAISRRKLINEQNQYYIKLSQKGIFSHLIYESCCEWCFFAVRYIGTREEKEDFLISMLVNRQPQTFFNAYLNADLAVMITESLYTNTPMLLESVEKHMKAYGMPFTRQHVVDFIRKCALFHDIGLNRISKIEGTQYRMLSENELTAIKQHPRLGAEIAEGSLTIYKDAILGHHKSFDQTSGYPDEDFSGSPLRIVCDILAICDALNAGTDKIGRSYREPKDFSILLSELISDSGTKYNTSIVNLFLKDMDLSCKADALISYRRENTYYDYYMKYFDKPSK